MTDLILHIGTFKTGTTALQKSLATNRNLLLQERGVLFPRAAEIPAGGHHNLVYEITRSWKHVPERGGFKELEQEIIQTRPRTVVISAENLSSYALGNANVAPSFEEFARRLGMRARLLCYVRPQWEYIDSYYSQGVKSGYTTCTFDTFVESALREDMYDYGKVVAPWQSWVDETAIRIYPGRGLIDDVYKFIGASELAPQHAVQANRNERFGAKRLEFMRRFGAALERARLPFQKRIPMAHRMRDLIVASDIEDVPFSGLNRDNVVRIHANFEAANAALSQRFALDSSCFGLPSRDFESTSFEMREFSEEDRCIFDDVVVRFIMSQGK